MTSFARSRWLSLWLAGTLLTLAEAPAPAWQTRTRRAKPSNPSRTIHRPKGPRRSYMGRPIAPVMGFEGAAWLVRPEREAEERPEEMLDALQLKPGMIVADIGAGVGYTSVRLAKRIGPTGKVYATDLQPEMLRMLIGNAKRARIKNIVPILAVQLDPKLPADSIDLAIMVDVYHESSEPEALLDGIRKALKKDGRLVLVEYRAEDPQVPIRPEHKMTLEQVRKEIEPRGYRFVESIETLPWQHIIIFQRGVDRAKAGDGRDRAEADQHDEAR